MYKEIVVCFKKPELSAEEFSRHWKEVHGPIFVESVPAVKRYIQNHLIQVPGYEYLGDGLVQMCWDTMETQKKFGVWSNARESEDLADDTPKFTGSQDNAPIWLTEEHVIWNDEESKERVALGENGLFSAADTGVRHKYSFKIISLLFRRADISRQDFNDYWMGKYPAVFSKHSPGVLKYVQNHLVESPGADFRGDGVEELWFENLESMKNFIASAKDNKVLADEVARFMDVNKEQTWLIEEHIMKWEQ